VTAVRDFLPEADMLELTLGEDASVIIRPSGTEPKVKAYYSVRGKNRADAETAATALVTAVTELLNL
jgi:phosphoglucomutase